MSIFVTAIIPAGGSGLRMGRELPKQFLDLAGQPVIVHTVRALRESPSVKAIVLVAPSLYLDRTREIIAARGLIDGVEVVTGGETRQDSVRAGLEHVPAETTHVLVHDCARALVETDLVERCVAASVKNGAAIAALPVSDTLKRESGRRRIGQTIDRTGIWSAQTPQVAEVDLLKRAFSSAAANGYSGTDEASLLEMAGIDVVLVPGSPVNMKITTPEDLEVAGMLLEGTGNGGRLMGALRVGQGFDAHRLVDERDLVLGGVRIDHDQGLLGHSDADVLTHALMDALLGAASLGDIGQHFPDSDEAYRGASSLVLLGHVISLLHTEGFRVVNCDLTVVAEHPSLSPYISEMECNIGKACGLQESAVNIKATTTEQMGFEGRGEGISAQAVVLLTMVGG